MAKYDPLYDFLRRQDAMRIVFTFDEVARLIGDKLADKAESLPQWWENETSTKGHSQSRAWMKTGYKASADLDRKIVSFERI